MKKQLLVIILLVCMGCNKAHNPFLHVRNPLEGTNTLHNPIVQSGSIKEPSVPIIESDEANKYGFIKGTAIIATMYAGLYVIKRVYYSLLREAFLKKWREEHTDDGSFHYAMIHQGSWSNFKVKDDQYYRNQTLAQKYNYHQNCIKIFNEWFENTIVYAYEEDHDVEMGEA
jgi:hypothetical protein